MPAKRLSMKERRFDAVSARLRALNGVASDVYTAIEAVRNAKRRISSKKGWRTPTAMALATLEAGLVALHEETLKRIHAAQDALAQHLNIEKLSEGEDEAQDRIVRQWSSRMPS